MVSKNISRKDNAIWAATQIFKKDKFKELLLYISKKSEDDRRYGATKLNKILYFCDFWAYGILSESITGANYKKRLKGPAPSALLPIRSELIENKEAELKEVPYFDTTQHRLIAKRDPNMSLFSEEEIRLVDQIIDILKNRNATEVSELSHAQAAWEFVDDGEFIPYYTFFLSNERLTVEDIVTGQSIATENGLLQ